MCKARNQFENNQEQGRKSMPKVQSGLAVGVGLMVLVCGVLGSRTQTLAGEQQKNITQLHCTAGQFPLFNGTQWVCADAEQPRPRFVDNGDGTITDHETGLMWEKKGTLGNATLCLDPTDCPNPHDVNNAYSWTNIFTPGDTAPDGSLFTNFLQRINTALSTSTDGVTVKDVCFAGHCDWRIPNVAELKTIPNCGASGPCIDPTFGPAQASIYWSSTTDAAHAISVWIVSLDGVGVTTFTKGGAIFARAVRGGR
jgi:hypothetical protein